MWVNDSDKRFYETRDGRVVEEGDPDAWSLIVGAYGSIPIEEARKHGLAEPEAPVNAEVEVPEAKAISAPPENKAKSAPDDTKSAEPDLRMSKAALVAIAEARGVAVVPDDMTKQDIIDAINNAK